MRVPPPLTRGDEKFDTARWRDDMLAIFDVGGTYLTMGYFDAGIALKMLERYRVTALYPSFVTIMQGLVYHPSFADVDLSRVKLMNSNFAVQPPGVAEPIMTAMPQALQVGSFGMTEAAGTVCTGGWDEALLVAVPIVVILLLFQRQLVRGLTAGAVKG